jgi:hypothetical protein
MNSKANTAKSLRDKAKDDENSSLDVLEKLGFDPIPSRNGSVDNDLIDQIRDSEGL